MDNFINPFSKDADILVQKFDKANRRQRFGKIENTN